jgi:hypothetical protein
VSADRVSSVPEPIPPAAPGGFAAAEPLPDFVRRIVREELRPIHLLLEEIQASLEGPRGSTERVTSDPTEPAREEDDGRV